MFKLKKIYYNLRGLSGLRGTGGFRGSKWVVWVEVGCVGRSGLRGSESVAWFTGKPHFHASLIFFTKR